MLGCLAMCLLAVTNIWYGVAVWMRMLWLGHRRATVVSRHLFPLFPPMTCMIRASKALATSLHGCVISNPYLAPEAFKEMSSALFSTEIGSLSIIVMTSFVFSSLLSWIEVSILPWSLTSMPSAVAAFTDFKFRPLEKSKSFLAGGAMHATIFLCPTLCLVG